MFKNMEEASMTEVINYLSSSVLVFFLCIIIVILMMMILSCNSSKLPISYPLIGSMFTILKNRERLVEWTSKLLIATPNQQSFTLHRPLGRRQIFTANAANVEHILKSHSFNYPKGDVILSTLKDFLGNGIFNSDGESWKPQRQISSHEFTTKSIKRFLEAVIDPELSDRLIPILTASDSSVVDFQDILHRFAYDTICKMAFGYDPQYLSSSLGKSYTTSSDYKFVVSFENSVKLITQRFNSNIPLVWKIQRSLNIGSERKLKSGINHVRGFAKQIVEEKKQKLNSSTTASCCIDDDLLSRFLTINHNSAGGTDDELEQLAVDIVISFVLVGQNTISSALTFFFWLLSNNPRVENEILKEIIYMNNNKLSEPPTFDELRGLTYTHASLCESMRLYPPVPLSTRTALNDDVLPDGTEVRKGSRVTYHSYAMGRLENVWGKDWGEFRPERWLQEMDTVGKYGIFIGKDPYSYPLFGAGPRACMGKEMSFLQMKRIVADILPRFKVVPMLEQQQPVLVSNLTIKMKDGFPVKIVKRRNLF